MGDESTCKLSQKVIHVRKEGMEEKRGEVESVNDMDRNAGELIFMSSECHRDPQMKVDYSFPLYRGLFGRGSSLSGW